MPTTLDEIKAKVDTLTEHELGELEKFLIILKGPPVPDRAEDLDARLARRVAEIESGTVQCRPGEEFFAELSERFP